MIFCRRGDLKARSRFRGLAEARNAGHQGSRDKDLSVLRQRSRPAWEMLV